MKNSAVTRIRMLSLILSLFFASFTHAQAPSYADQRNKPVVGSKGAVVSDDLNASEWGAQILRQGGNAVDAAVATAFYLAVTRPNYASLGGGGFMVICLNKATTCETINYREIAPLKATRDMFLVDGKASSDLSQDSALSSGVPGVPAGLLLALEKHGRLKRQKLLSRPIQIAERGFRFTANLEAGLSDRWDVMNADGKRIFSCGRKGKGMCQPGDTLRQPELARVLAEISEKGAAGFYQGPIATRIANEMKKAKGIITAEDLKAYQAKVQAPLVSQYKDYEIVGMGLPSSGGIIEAQVFSYLEKAEASGAFDRGYGSTQSIHAMATALSLAFSDRAKYMGDLNEVPVQTLLSDSYLSERWKNFFSTKAFKNPDASNIEIKEGQNTTHFNVMDSEGNAVALTTTVNDNFGSAFVVPGTGIVMNNEMDDFVSAPGVPNLFGLVGSKANEIAPGKRPLSSMSPTIVRNKVTKENMIAIGGAGGPRIATATLMALVHRLRFNMGIADAVAAGRIHQQWMPQELVMEENAFSPEVRAELEKMGHKIKLVKSSARLQAIERFSNGRTWAYSDPRSEGAAAAE